MVLFDVVVLFATRSVRLFSYGSTGVVLALFLNTVGLSDSHIGALLTLTLLGDSAISLGVTRWADGLGRRTMLTGSCLLMVFAGLAFGLTPHPSFWLLLCAATVGVISPSGNEVGPFMALEQSILSELVSPANRTYTFAWYNLVGYALTAFGAAAAGNAITWAQHKYGITELYGYRMVFVQYAAAGVVLMVLFLLLTKRVELGGAASARLVQQAAGGKAAPAAAVAGAAGGAGAAGAGEGPGAAGGDEEAAGLREPLLGGTGASDGGAAGSAHAGAAAAGTSPATATAAPGAGGSGSSAAPTRSSALGLSPRSQRTVTRLCCLFALDSLAGGLVTATLLAYFFQVKYGVTTAYLGNLLLGANLIAAVSALLSGWVAQRIGLINTMVFTHLPSNVLMILVPLMPNLAWATAMVFMRFSISQMDVAPRASYVAGVVRPEERTAAMGVVNIAKSLGAACGPVLTGLLADKGLFAWAFYLCGGLKIVYDLSLLWAFSHIKPEH